MNTKDELNKLNLKYAKMQNLYGAKELDSIYNGGATNFPDICFHFINSTG